MYRQSPTAASQDLGPLEARYSESRTARPVLIFVTFFGLPGVALLSGFQSGPGEVFAGDRTTNGLLGVALIGAAIAAIVLVMRKATLSVETHERGLVWTERGLTRRIPWSAVKSIRGAHTSRQVAGAEVARTAVYTIALDAGRELVVTNLLVGAHALATRVERAVAEAQLPSIRTRLDAGESVAFGALLVTPRGIELQSQSVAWSALDRVEIAHGTVHVRARDGETMSVDWSKIDNARLLLEVVREKKRAVGAVTTS